LFWGWRSLRGPQVARPPRQQRAVNADAFRVWRRPRQRLEPLARAPLAKKTSRPAPPPTLKMSCFTISLWMAATPLTALLDTHAR
jgi:hypothetical protein